jgi:ABC transporter substrate binding protein
MADTERTPNYDAFREGLRDLGYIEGRDIILEFRLARGDFTLLRKLAAELVNLPVDVIVGDGGPTVARIALDVTKQIPIVMGAGGDMVAFGLAASWRGQVAISRALVACQASSAAKRLEIVRTAFSDILAVAGRTKRRRRISEQSRRLPVLAVRRLSRVLRWTPLRSVGLSDRMFWDHRRNIIALINGRASPQSTPSGNMSTMEA